MRKSLPRQLALIAFLGPFGLFYTNVVAALALVFVHLLAIYIFADTLSVEHLIYVLPTTLISSLALGAYLVGKHNQQATNDFQFSSYYGNISCNTVRKESVERDYHRVLSKVRRKKHTRNIQVTCLTLLCITCSALILKPRISYLIPESARTAAEQDNTETSVHLTSGLSEKFDTELPTQPTSSSSIPRWNHKQQGTKLTSELKATEYTSSSDGPYLATIQLDCNDSGYSIRLNVKEILGTDATHISITLDDNPPYVQTWALDSSYLSAISHSTTALKKQLKMARRIAIGYKPFGAHLEKTATFNLSGSAKEISALENKCSQLQSIASN